MHKVDPACRFSQDFAALCGVVEPFPWQLQLYHQWVKGHRCLSCCLPTGLGKTSVIAIWLLALAKSAPSKRLPRRLVYVVNRRTIVDQATREAEKLREKLQKPELKHIHQCLRKLSGVADSEIDNEIPLCISTLRGQFADNGEWSADPARPAIVIGTVDMIGSRLLFSGYGRGFKHRPLHAGFLGQDTLLVHDEAHLEPAFQELLNSIRREQDRCNEFRSLHTMALTATPRTDDDVKTFALTDEDQKHPVIKQRLEAKKTIVLHPLEDEKETANKVAALAIKRAESEHGKALLIFVRKVEDVKKVVDALGRAKGIDRDKQIEQLTGTLRGKERDELVWKPVFQRFLPLSNRDGMETPVEGTVFLVCTSAGEVGVDISADHLVCDLTTFESMAQRFGRVNRYGDGNAKIDIVYPESFGRIDKKTGELKDDEMENRRQKTLELLKKLPVSDSQYDASPKELGDLRRRCGLPCKIEDAFSPVPTILPATDILFDAWALTSLREQMPGRPPVADWLHGVPTEWQPPETRVAWREEVQWIIGELLQRYKPDDLLEVYPLKPHELLKDRSRRVFEELKRIAERFECVEGTDVPVWIEVDRGVEVTTLRAIANGNEADIANRVVILPPFAGGLNGGMLDGNSPSADDVSGQWLDDKGNQRRARVWGDAAPPSGMRLARSIIDLRPDSEETEENNEVKEEQPGDEQPSDSREKVSPRPPGRLWKWYSLPRSADDDGSRSGHRPVLLDVHTNDVKGHVERMVAALGLADTAEGKALIMAAKWHDAGKNRKEWQRSIGNNGYPELVLAKSGHRRPPHELTKYRHEFGSLFDVAESEGGWSKLTDEEKDLVLHFIAAHHGRARPHFPTDEAFDPQRPSATATTVAREIPRRFAKLQRKYGRWGLAYLESILRAADAAASVYPSETLKEEAVEATDMVAVGGTQ